MVGCVFLIDNKDSPSKACPQANLIDNSQATLGCVWLTVNTNPAQGGVKPTRQSRELMRQEGWVDVDNQGPRGQLAAPGDCHPTVMPSYYKTNIWTKEKPSKVPVLSTKPSHVSTLNYRLALKYSLWVLTSKSDIHFSQTLKKTGCLEESLLGGQRGTECQHKLWDQCA